MPANNSRRWIERLFLCGVAGLCWWVGCTPAQACTWWRLSAEIARATSSAEPVQQQGFFESAVPPNGPIIVHLRCEGTTFCQTDTPTLRVGPESAPLEGNLEVLRGGDGQYLVWTPARAMPAGATYTVEVSWHLEPDPALPAGQDSGGTTFHIVVDRDSTYPPTVELDEIPVVLLARGIPVGQTYCCEASCADYCMTEYEVTHAVLRADTSGYKDRSGVAFRLVQEVGECGRGWGSSNALETTFRKPSAQYCATLEALDLAHRTIRRRRICVDADPTVVVGELLETTPYIAALGACFGGPPVADAESPPPPGLLSAWCEGIRESCDQGGVCAEPGSDVLCTQASPPPHEPATDPPLASETPWPVGPTVSPALNCEAVHVGELSGTRDLSTGPTQACNVTRALGETHTSRWWLACAVGALAFRQRRQR